VVDLNPVALAVREIFTGVCKSKPESLKQGHVVFDLVFGMPSKLLLVVDANNKFEVSSVSRSRDIGVRILKLWASSAILDLTLGVF